MPLSAPPARRPNHRRTISYQSYRRDDELWDIEVELRDEKAVPYHDMERGLRQPGAPVHDMAARVTFDDEMVVHAVEVDMRDVPFSLCSESSGGCQSLVGAKLSERWRQTLTEHLGGSKGCVHLRELLFGVATVAMQTLWAHFRERDLLAGDQSSPHQQQPSFVDNCYAWAVNRSVVARYFPKFYVALKE